MKLRKCIVSGVLMAALLCESLLGAVPSGFMQLHAEETAVNVASGKPVQVSEVDPQTPDMTGEKAVDGVIGTADSDTARWSGGILKAGISGNTEQWISIDLKAEKTVVQSISVYFYKLVWSKDYKIQTRAAESEEWTDIFHVDSSDRASNTQNPTDEISNSDVKELKRYVRFLFAAGSLNSAAGGHRISIREIVISGTQTGGLGASSSAEILAKIPAEITVGEDDDRLLIPSVSEGYAVEVYGSEVDRIVGDDGKISPYRLNDRSFQVILKAKSTSNELDTAKKNVTVTVCDNTGKYPSLFPQVANPNSMPDVLPTIQEWYGYEGNFVLTDDTKIVVNDRANVGLFSVAEEMKEDISEISGKTLAVETGTAAGAGNIYLESLPQDTYGTGEEGYFLINGENGIQIFSATKTGVLYGTVTVEQILYQDTDHTMVPKGVIRDYPLYGVRGMMFDVARIPTRMQFLKDYTKILKWYKMNDMQIHLNDTQWSEPDRNSSNPQVYDKVEASHRLESELFPSLAKQKSKFEVTEGQWNNKYGGDYAGRYDYYYSTHTGTGEELYYTKEEYRSLQSLADARGVKLVSELDTPGHSTPYNKYVYNHQEEVINALAEHGYIRAEDYLNTDGSIKKNFYTHNPNNFEVFSIDDENSNEEVRQNAIHAKIFIKALFDEYLGGVSGIDALFTTDTIHAGVDEYFDQSDYNKQAFRRYMNEMYDFLGKTNDGYQKEVQMWGGLKLMGGSEGINRNIVLSMWNCRAEEDLNARLNDGFQLINIPQQYLYTTPGRYHKDILRENFIYYNWEPEVFDGGGRVEKGEPQFKGVLAALWGDSNRSGVTEADLNERYLRAIAMVSEKTWGGTKENDTFLEYEQTFDRLKEGPGTQIANQIESRTNLVLDYDFENISENENMVFDRSGNGYHGTITGGKVITKENKKMLQFDGQTKIETPLTSLSYPYTMSFDLYLDGTESNDKNSALFGGYDGRLIAKGLNDELGINRSHYTQSLGYALESGSHRITVVGTYQVTKLYVDGKFKKILYAEGRDPDHGGNLRNENWTDKDNNFNTTFVFPLNVIGENFSGCLGNIRAYNKALSVEELAAEGKMAGIETDVARNRGAYADIGNPSFWGDTMRLFPAWKSTDGDGHVTGVDGVSTSYESRWNSSDRDDDFLMVDLGCVRNISKVVIDWEANRYASAYKIMVSENGTNFTEVKSVTGNTSARTEDTFSETKARYVKMQGVTRKSGANEYAVYEMKVFQNVDKTALNEVCQSAEELLETHNIHWESEGDERDMYESVVLARAVCNDVMAGQEETDLAKEKLEAEVSEWDFGGDTPLPMEKYTVTFESNGGTAVADQEVESGKKAKKPENPTKSGYVFAGWYTDDDTFEQEFAFGTEITANITLYAKWEKDGGSSEDPKKYTVTFESNGGTAVAGQEIESGKKAEKPENPTKKGFTFGGWYTDNGTFQTEYAFSEAVTDNLVLYAKWNELPPEPPKKYRVVFMSNGKVYHQQTVQQGNKPVEPPKPVRSGYTFGGWYRNTACTLKYNFTAVTGNLTLYAKWTVIKPVKPVKKVTSITFETGKYQIAKGKKIDLKKIVTVLPLDAANSNLTWISSNSKYASVSDGVVTMQKAGAGKKVTIMAKAADGSGISAAVQIQIMKNAVKKITLKSVKTVKAGKRIKVKADVKTTGKKSVNKKLKWTSSNPSYAVVDSKGNVKAFQAGKGKQVKITAESTDGSGKKKTIKIKIK